MLLSRCEHFLPDVYTDVNTDVYTDVYTDVNTQMCTQMCTQDVRCVHKTSDVYNRCFHYFHKNRICGLFVCFMEIAEMRTIVVFGVIFSIFIDFECPSLRRWVSARCVLPKRCYGSQTSLLSSLCGTGLWSLANLLQPWGRRDTKKGTEDVPYGIKLVNPLRTTATLAPCGQQRR